MIFRRKPREGVAQRERYPEPWFITERPLLRLLYRGLLGRPMDGDRWTNSTFWRGATAGEDQAWLRLAGWQRALIRVMGAWCTFVLTPVALICSLLLERHDWTQLLLEAHALIALTAALPVLTYQRVRDYGMSIPWAEKVTHAETLDTQLSWTRRRVVEGRRQWELEKIQPVARTVAGIVQRPYHPADAAHWVHVPRDYREGGQVEILLPGNFAITTEAAQRRLAHSAAGRLGIKDPGYAYELAGIAPRLVLTAPALPPEHVSFDDLALPLSAHEDDLSSFVMGMAGREALTVNLADDSPHLALSAGSGGGKSVLIKGVVAQWLHKGGFALILDWKEESQEWAENLPGVRYIRDIEALHDACVQIGEEIEFRKANRGTPRIPLLVVSEEWGVTAPLLTSYWQAYRASLDMETRRTTPVKSPAHEAIMKLNFAGRSLQVHQFLVAQRFSARVTNGNADLRESFTTIFMTRWKAQTFKMLAPDIKPIPRKLTKPGQWLAITGDTAVRFQAALWSDEEARAYAVSGRPNPASPWCERWQDERLNVGTLNVPTLGDQLGLALTGPSSDTDPHLDYIDAEVVESPKLRKLRDIVDVVDHLAITYSILQTASKRDPNFPKVQGGSQFKGYLYSQDEVVEWARRKRAAEAAEASRK